MKAEPLDPNVRDIKTAINLIGEAWELVDEVLRNRQEYNQEVDGLYMGQMGGGIINPEIDYVFLMLKKKLESYTNKGD